MALQISEFVGNASVNAQTIQVPDGPPSRVTNVTGHYAVAPRAVLIRIKGTGSIKWPNVDTPEEFDGLEFRQVRAGDMMEIL